MEATNNHFSFLPLPKKSHMKQNRTGRYKVFVQCASLFTHSPHAYNKVYLGYTYIPFNPLIVQF